MLSLKSLSQELVYRILNDVIDTAQYKLLIVYNEQSTKVGWMYLSSLLPPSNMINLPFIEQCMNESAKISAWFILG